MSPEDALAEFVVLTEGSLGEAHDFFQLLPDEQAQAIWNYRHMNWARSPDVLGKILSVLGILATVGIDISGAAGAIAAIKTL
jgi:hypothetical protein